MKQLKKEYHFMMRQPPGSTLVPVAPLFRSRRSYLAQRAAAVALQSAYRRAVVVRRYAHSKSAATRIASAYRMHVARRQLSTARRAATTIASTFRMR